MKTFDFKSFFIGLLSTACIFLLLGSAKEGYQNSGRYQLVRDADLSLRYVMYDTYTGSAVALKFSDEIKAEKGKPHIPGKKIREYLEKDN